MKLDICPGKETREKSKRNKSKRKKSSKVKKSKHPKIKEKAVRLKELKLKKANKKRTLSATLKDQTLEEVYDRIQKGTFTGNSDKNLEAKGGEIHPLVKDNVHHGTEHGFQKSSSGEYND